MDFSAYLSELGSEQLDRLYDSPWTCQAVLRSLPPLCQHFVLQHLFLAAPLPMASVHAGVKQGAAGKRDAALTQLVKLQASESPMRMRSTRGMQHWCRHVPCGCSECARRRPGADMSLAGGLALAA